MGLGSAIKKGFKSIGKGFKSAFKSIGKGLKSAFKAFGKFMGKIGIVGQLAISFMLPGVGAMLAKGFNATVGAAFKGATGFLAKGGKIAQTAGKILESGAKFAKSGASAFKTVTDGVSSFIGEFTKTALKKIPGMETMFPKLAQASDSFFVDSSTGKSAWSTVQTGIDENINAITKSFNDGIEKFGEAKKILTAKQQNIVNNAQNIMGKDSIPGGIGKIKSSLLDLPDAELVTTPTTGGIEGPANITGASQAGSNAGFDTFKPEGFDARGLPDAELVMKPVTGGTNSLLSKAGNFIKDLPGNTLDSVKEQFTDFKDGRTLGRAVADETLDKGIDMVSGVVEEDAKTRLSQEIGIIEQPEEYFASNAPAQYIDVGTGSYQSPEINDRAMQMSLNPTAFLQQNNYGYGANIYEQQMRVKAGGSTAYG